MTKEARILRTRKKSQCPFDKGSSSFETSSFFGCLGIWVFGYFFLTCCLTIADDKAAGLITSAGGEIDMGKSVPGVIKTNSDFAFPFLLGSNGERTVAAGGKAGEGRVIAFSHGSFLKSGGLLDQESALKLVLNSMRWTGRSSKPVVGLHPSSSEIASYLEEAGVEVKNIPPSEVEGDVVSTYCLIGHDRSLTEDDIAYLKEFVSRGGGLVVSTTPWAFKKNHPNFAKDFPANQLISAAGLEFLPDGYAGTKTTLLVSRSNPVESVTQQGKMIGEGKTSSGDSKNPIVIIARRLIAEHKSLSESQIGEMLDELEKAKQLRGKDLGSFLAALKELNETIGPIIPTKENPVVPGQNKLVDAIIDLETHFNLNLPAGAMYAIPASADYPGKVEAPEKTRSSHPDDQRQIQRLAERTNCWRLGR